MNILWTLVRRVGTDPDNPNRITWTIWELEVIGDGRVPGLWEMTPRNFGPYSSAEEAREYILRVLEPYRLRGASIEYVP